MIKLNTLYNEPAQNTMKRMNDEFVNMVMTSPPYWALRDYGTGENQLGLEPTFDEYINNLCDIFDEVKRVLRKDGTCWINIGDSYSHSGGQGNQHKQAKAFGHFKPHSVKNLPPKSLCNIPARFSIEMQKRRGKIVKSEKDAIWLAAIVDGEGSLTIHKRANNRKNPTYGAMLRVHNTDKRLIDKVRLITNNIGSVQVVKKEGYRKLYGWCVMSNQAKTVIEDIYPYLISKKDQAKIVLNCDSSGKKADESWKDVKLLNQGQLPKNVYQEPIIKDREPWTLRNVIIWKKNNCMPSSAKDRFTVDFEYLFFFSKNKKYYFEQQFEKHLWAERDKRSKKHWSENISKDENTKVRSGNYAMNQVSYGEQGRNKRTVWTINPKPFKDAHFAVYPEELCETPIKAGCPEGGIVYDPFAGSGTTCLVAHRLNRKFIGSEISKEYCKIAEKRLAVTKQEQFA